MLEFEPLEQRFKDLQKEFENDIDMEGMLDKVSLSIPKKMSKYIYLYHDLLTLYSEYKDQKDELYYKIMSEYKMGESALSRINWSATELKQIIESTSNMRELNKHMALIGNMMKTTENMMSELKSISYSVNNALTYKKIMNGSI